MERRADQNDYRQRANRTGLAMQGASPTKPKTVRLLMFSITSPAADFWFWVSNYALILGAIIVAVATLSSILFSSAREQFANERITANEADTAKANASAAAAGQRASEADARAAEANRNAEKERIERLRLEAKFAPRFLPDARAQQLAKAVASLKGITIDLVSYEGLGTDVAVLSNQLAEIMNGVGIVARVFTPMGGSGLIRGVAVRDEAGSPAELDAAADQVAKALNDAGLSSSRMASYPVGEQIANGYMGPTGVIADAKLRILVGAKP